MKKCACGKRYDAKQWAALRLIGRMSDGDGGLLELRNCSCGSTLAVPVQPESARRPTLAPQEGP